MSHTIAHRPHVHRMPSWLPTVLAVLVAILSAAAIIYAINQVSTLPASTSTPTPLATAIPEQAGGVVLYPAGGGVPIIRRANDVTTPAHATLPGQLRFRQWELQRRMLMNAGASVAPL